MKGLNSVNWSQNKNVAGYNDKNGEKDDLPDESVLKKERHDLLQHDEAPEIDITKDCGNTGSDSSVKDSSQLSVISTKIKSVDILETNKSTPKLDSQTVLPAHKLLLASVSPVFRRQFYDSIPPGEVLIIEDSPINAFKMMIDYIYQNTAGECVENLVDVCELLDTYYLAEKYEVLMLGWKEKILNRLSVMPVDLSNYESLVSSLLNYSYFEDASQVLGKCVFDFIKILEIPLELVQGAIDSKNDDIKHEVLTKLVSVDEKSILETVKAAHDIFESEGCKLDETKSLRPVMISCVRRFEDLKQDPLKFSQFSPDPDSDLPEAFYLLYQYLKNNFCKNCDSSACKEGECVDISEVKAGVRVVVDGSKQGAVSRVSLVKVNKLANNGHFRCLVACSDTYCSPSCPNRRLYTYCPVCKRQAKSMDASVGCNGVHCISESDMFFAFGTRSDLYRRHNCCV